MGLKNDLAGPASGPQVQLPIMPLTVEVRREEEKKEEEEAKEEGGASDVRRGRENRK